MPRPSTSRGGGGGSSGGGISQVSPMLRPRQAQHGFSSHAVTPSPTFSGQNQPQGVSAPQSGGGGFTCVARHAGFHQSVSGVLLPRRWLSNVFFAVEKVSDSLAVDGDTSRPSHALQRVLHKRARSSQSSSRARCTPFECRQLVAGLRRKMLTNPLMALPGRRPFHTPHAPRSPSKYGDLPEVRGGSTSTFLYPQCGVCECSYGHIRRGGGRRAPENILVSIDTDSSTRAHRSVRTNQSDKIMP